MPEISLWQFFIDLTNPQLAFLPRALTVAVIAAIVCGVVGCHVVLRGMAFIGDAVAHAVFPGLALAFAMEVSVVAGGAVAGVIVALVIAAFSQRRRVKEDTVIGIFFAAAFALGLVLISRVDGYTGSLTSFLFGSLTGVPLSDIWVSLGVGTLIIAVLVWLGPGLTAVALDRESARAMNLPVFVLDVVLYLAVTAAVVISVRTIGNILVLALLVTPPATARLLTDRLAPMMLTSAAIGAVGSVLGVWLSWAYDIPTGASVVLSLTAIFLATWVFSPRHGVLAGRMPRTTMSTTASTASATGSTSLVMVSLILGTAGLVIFGPVANPGTAHAAEVPAVDCEALAAGRGAGADADDESCADDTEIDPRAVANELKSFDREIKALDRVTEALKKDFERAQTVPTTHRPAPTARPAAPARDKAPRDDAARDDAARADAAPEPSQPVAQAPAGQSSAGQLPEQPPSQPVAVQPPVVQAPSEQVPVEQIPQVQAPQAQSPQVQSPQGQAPSEQPPQPSAVAVPDAGEQQPVLRSSLAGEKTHDAARVGTTELASTGDASAHSGWGFWAGLVFGIGMLALLGGVILIALAARSRADARVEDAGR